MPRKIIGLSAIAQRYTIVFCDVWGVLHNGVRAHDGAVAALRRFRAERGQVHLLTNAPRPATIIGRQLTEMGVPNGAADGAYDSIVTSGDVTRTVLAARATNADNDAKTVFHLGPDRDLAIYDGLNLRFGDADEAELISCTGLFDDTTETPETYRPMLERFLSRNVPLVGANPDIVVERGNKLIWCGGAIAQLYQKMGGEVILAGKPFPPMYDEALQRAGNTDPANVLAIGDGLPTDIRGANKAGIDVLLITEGIHAAEMGTSGHPDSNAVSRMLADEGLTATAFVPRLVW